ncbi:MAG TPA: D-2-hydroxyacid dehydrogenase [Chromatiales bacterium]|nr:D-2-hydroxyacid dehydrogenase [Chromatiales bacterium]
MRAVFLDYGSLGPADIDPGPLEHCVADFTLFDNTSPEQVTERIASAQIVLVNKVRLTAAELESAPDLRLICLAATGTDNVDLQAARRLGIAVCNIRDYCTDSVAQHVLGLILALTQQLIPCRELLAAGGWTRSEHFCRLDFPIRELRGKRLGIVGYGTLGRAVAELARPLGMDVCAARRPYRLDDEDQITGDPERLGLGRLLRTADVISLHCPLNDQTRGMIGSQAFELMKPDAVLINTARGALIDTRALPDALRNGQLAGAGIDVLETEPPPPEHPLLTAQLPNLIVTPHIAWAAREARQRAVHALAGNIQAFLSGQPINRVA